MYVRTIVDVPHGAQLTVCHTSQWDARPVRQAALLQVRTCGRAGGPLPGALALSRAAPKHPLVLCCPPPRLACLGIQACLTCV